MSDATPLRSTTTDVAQSESREKLSEPQRRALQAAAEGKLMIVYGWGSTKPSAYIDGVSPMVKGNVRQPTITALKLRGLIVVPVAEYGRSSIAAQLTNIGRAALNGGER